MVGELLRSRIFGKLLLVGIVVSIGVATGVFAVAEVQEAVQQYQNALASVSK